MKQITEGFIALLVFALLAGCQVFEVTQDKEPLVRIAARNLAVQYIKGGEGRADKLEEGANVLMSYLETGVGFESSIEAFKASDKFKNMDQIEQLNWLDAIDLVNMIKVPDLKGPELDEKSKHALRLVLNTMLEAAKILK